MANKTITVCDGCGKRVDNGYAEKGWVKIYTSIGSISLSRSHGEYVNGSYKTDFLASSRFDFCGVPCLVIALDQRRDEYPVTLVQTEAAS